MKQPLTFRRAANGAILAIRWTLWLCVQLIRATCHGILMLTEPPAPAKTEARPNREATAKTKHKYEVVTFPAEALKDVPDVIEAGDPRTKEYIQALFK